MMLTSSSLVVLDIVIMTTYGATSYYYDNLQSTSEDKAGTIATFGFWW